MLVSNSNKFIVFHIPKTAGSSMTYELAKYLNPCVEPPQPNKTFGGWQPLHHIDRIQHRPLQECRQTEFWEKTYFKASFVRNPYEKIVSQYHFNSHSYGFQNSTFKEYIKAWNLGKEISRFPQLNTSYINEKLDFIGRFENLQEDFNIVCNKIGIPQQQLPHINATKHKHYTEYYDDETKQIVAEKYAKDIEYFGYEFGE